MIEQHLPVTAIVVTRNEEANIEACLQSLQHFSEIIVVDSDSDDATVSLAKKMRAKVASFSWNGHYPKKRQWCLDTLETAYDWVFFIDADERCTPNLTAEIAAIDYDFAGYFIKGRYVIDGQPLRFGLHNNKLCLLHKERIAFPIVNDLDCKGMGEIEGHYQPVLIDNAAQHKIGQLYAPLLHYADINSPAWVERHERYAAWEVAMNANNAWPSDPIWWRQALKSTLRTSKLRPFLTFVHSYVLKLGFLEGRAGWQLASSRYCYYMMIRKQSAATKNRAASTNA